MHSLRAYILKNFSDLFFSLFVPLFAIASIIFLIKLATYTAVIELSLWEMFKLYLFILPELLFYILPVCFFVATALCLHRLSTDNEMVVIFSLGIAPSFLLRSFLLPASLLTLLLVFNFFILFPHTTTLSTNFVRYKQSEAKFNLQASEAGHSFGEWHLYIGAVDEQKSLYTDIVLFRKSSDDETFIQASQAKMSNVDSVLKLELFNGKGYTYSEDSLSQLEFKSMSINSILETDLRAYKSPLEFWLDPDRQESKKQMFITDILLSLFPLTALFAALSIGIAHVRHNRGFIFLWLFVSLLLYYGSTIALESIIGFYTIPLVLTVWIVITYLIYRKKIVARF